MKIIEILGKKFEEIITPEEIAGRVKEIASVINREYDGREVIFIGILNGAFLFTADLFRHITLKARITFVKLASYEGTSTTGSVKELIGWNEDIKGADVIVVEDIVDTGATLERIVDELRIRKVASVKIATLLLKPGIYKKAIPVDYVGFKVPDNYVIGYGLDFEGYARNLPSVYKMIK